MTGLFLLAALLLIAGAGCGDKFDGGGTTNTTGTSAANEVTLSGSVSEVLAKPSSKPAGGAGLLHSPMSGGDVKVIDSTGAVVGTATIASDGTYSASVAKGDNYTVKATKGNVCLKSFVEKADADKTVPVDPASSAIVKSLSKKIGDGNLGEEGHDVSTAIASVDISAILVAIKSDGLLTAIAQAIAADIAAHANYSSTTVSAGYASAAGDGDASAIAISITITVTVTPQSSAPVAPTGVAATAGDGVATVSWAAVSEAASYNLYYSATAGTAGIKVSGITATSYTLNGLSNGVTYYFTVTAVNASGESAGSAQVSATPTAAPTAWVGTKQFGVAGRVTDGNGVAVDASGNVYVTGRIDGGLDGNAQMGNSDAFIRKYNSSGVKQWTKQFGVTNKGTIAFGVAVDASGNVYVAGSTSGGLDGNTQAGLVDFFVAKYDTSGAKQWIWQLGAAGAFTAGAGVAVDASGNVYVAGSTSGGLDGNTLTAVTDFFVAKYDTSGVKQWVRQLGAGDNTSGSGVGVDSSGNVFVTGSTDGAMDGNTLMGNNDLYVAKYSSTGVRQWIRQLGATGISCGGNGVAADSSGNVYMSGYTTGDLDGTTQAGAIVIKYDSSGVKQWTKLIGEGTGTGAGGISIDATGNIFVDGMTDRGLDGNTLMGMQDFFVTKYSSAWVKQWTRQLGVAGKSTYALGHAVDTSGNAFVAGIMLNGGLDGNTQIGLEDAFVTKYSADGVKQ